MASWKERNHWIPKNKDYFYQYFKLCLFESLVWFESCAKWWEKLEIGFMRDSWRHNFSLFLVIVSFVLFMVAPTWCLFNVIFLLLIPKKKKRK